MKKLISLILALVFVFTIAFAEVDSEKATEEIIVMTFAGNPVLLSDIQQYSELLYSDGYIDSPSDYLSGLEYILRYSIGINLLIETPSDYLSDEEISHISEDAAAYYEECVDSYVDYFAEENATPEDIAMLQAEAIEGFGVSCDEYVNSSLKNAAYEILLAGISAEVSEDEIYAVYMDEVEYEMTAIDSVFMYEYYTAYYGYEFFFRPEGYRGILHILVNADEDALSAYANADTDEEKAAAAEAVIASISDTLADIYAAYEAGTPFVDLIAQYNIDPGMMDADNLANGYAVHPESITWMDEFTQGAFSERMQNPGDVSDPVVTSYGVHILYYLSDLPGGPLEMSADIHDMIYSYLYENAQNVAVDEMLRQYEVAYTDAYAQYIGVENFLDK